MIVIFVDFLFFGGVCFGWFDDLVLCWVVLALSYVDVCVLCSGGVEVGLFVFWLYLCLVLFGFIWVGLGFWVLVWGCLVVVCFVSVSCYVRLWCFFVCLVFW